MELLTYEHMDSEKKVPNRSRAEAVSSLKKINIKPRKGQARFIREQILRSLWNSGWSDRVTISRTHKITLTGIRGRTGACVQLGNMARFYADLLKLQTCFHNGLIESSIYILPLMTTSKALGSNLVHFERLCKELQLFAPIITLPILVIGFKEERQ